MANFAKIRERVHELNPIDDAMFKKMAEEREFCEEILQVILEDPKLVVLENKAQWSGTNLQGKSVIMDCKCLLGDGRTVDIEVQRNDNDDHQRRVRYSGAIMTTNITDPGKKYEKVPDVIVVYISRFNVFKAESKSELPALVHIDRTIRESGEVVHNGFEEIYVNAKVKDGSKVSDLMDVFTNDETYDPEQFPQTSRFKQQYKEKQKGKVNMSDKMREIYEDVYSDELKAMAEERAQWAEERAQMAETYEKMAEERAKIVEKYAQMVDEKAQMADEKAQMADEKAKITEERAQIADNIKEATMDKSRELAVNLKKEGMDLDFIVKVTNIARDVVEKWLKEKDE